MARKSKTTIKANNGKTYQYQRITRKVGMKRNKRGELVPEYKQFLGRTKAEAEAKYQDYISKSALSRDKTFGELIDWWQENIYSKSTLSRGSKALHTSAFRRIFADASVLGENIADVKGADLQTVFSNCGKGGSTQRHCRSFLHRFFLYAVSQGIVSTDATQALVTDEPKRKRKDQSIEVFSEDELKCFLNDTPLEHRLRLLIVLAIYTGARIGELLALTYDDIQEDQVIINKSLKEISMNGSTVVEVEKTKTASSVRAIPIEKKIVIDAIRAHKDWHLREMLKNGYRTDFVFTTASGNLYFISTIRTAYYRLCKHIGIEKRGFHCFRHTFGTRLASNGVPIATVSKLMGHTSVSVTAKYYVNISDEEKRIAITALAL